MFQTTLFEDAIGGARYGAAGTREKVRWYQTILRVALGYRGIAINGRHNDPATRAAMRSAGARLGFDAKSGYLTVAGNAALTRAALGWIYRGRNLQDLSGRDAVKQFQRDYGLVPDGKVGTLTRTKMVQVLSGALPTPVRGFNPRMPKAKPGSPTAFDAVADWELSGDWDRNHGIIGQDDRKTVYRTVSAPERWFCQLVVRFPGSATPYMGSGLLIGPRHILTAAHNVADDPNDDNGFRRFVRASSAFAIPACNHTPRRRRFFRREPFGRFEIDLEKSYIPKKWIDLNQSGTTAASQDPLERASDWDVAVLCLTQPLGKSVRRPRKLKFRKGNSTYDKPLAFSYWGGSFYRVRVGFPDIAPRTPDASRKWDALARNKRFHTAGYPGTQKRQMRTAAAVGGVRGLSQSETGSNALLGWRRFSHALDATKGQSGSPVWVERPVKTKTGKRTRRDIVGVVTYLRKSSDYPRVQNFGVIITPKIVRQIVARFPKTFSAVVERGDGMRKGRIVGLKVIE